MLGSGYQPFRQIRNINDIDSSLLNTANGLMLVSHAIAAVVQHDDDLTDAQNGTALMGALEAAGEDDVILVGPGDFEIAFASYTIASGVRIIGIQSGPLLHCSASELGEPLAIANGWFENCRFINQSGNAGTQYLAAEGTIRFTHCRFDVVDDSPILGLTNDNTIIERCELMAGATSDSIISDQVDTGRDVTMTHCTLSADISDDITNTIEQGYNVLRA